MNPKQLSPWQPRLDFPIPSRGEQRKEGISFQRVLAESKPSLADGPQFVQIPSSGTAFQGQSAAPPVPLSGSRAVEAYRKQESHSPEAKPLSDLEKYRDDQLLSNPGGDHYDLEGRRVTAQPGDQASFWGRIKKDVTDAVGNVKNFFENLLFGAKTHYRDENNQIQEIQKKGVLGSLVEFVKDLGSAFSFGAWRPDGEEEPRGFGQRFGFFFSKVKESLFGDLLQGVGGSLIDMGEDLLFAGWNLLETLPDATLGNFEAGRKATTAIFDNGQVLMDYLTDILPCGEAWIRVHSPDLKNLKKMELPIDHNIRRPERTKGDERWQTIRNTPFRKAIETIGSLMTDILSLDVLGQIKLFTDEKK